MAKLREILIKMLPCLIRLKTTYSGQSFGNQGHLSQMHAYAPC